MFNTLHDAEIYSGLYLNPLCVYNVFPLYLKCSHRLQKPLGNLEPQENVPFSWGIPQAREASLLAPFAAYCLSCLGLSPQQELLFKAGTLVTLALAQRTVVFSDEDHTGFSFPPFTSYVLYWMNDEMGSLHDTPYIPHLTREYPGNFGWWKESDSRKKSPVLCLLGWPKLSLSFFQAKI